MSQLYENNAKCRRQSDSAANNEKSARNQNRKTAESQERREMSWEHIIVQFLVAVPATIAAWSSLKNGKKLTENGESERRSRGQAIKCTVGKAAASSQEKSPFGHN